MNGPTTKTNSDLPQGLQGHEDRGALHSEGRVKDTGSDSPHTWARVSTRVHADARHHSIRRHGPHLCSSVTSRQYSETSRPCGIRPLQRRRRAGPRPFTTNYGEQTKTHPSPEGPQGHTLSSRVHVAVDTAPRLHRLTAKDGLQDKRPEARLDSGWVCTLGGVTPVPAHEQAAVRPSPRDATLPRERPQPALSLLVLSPWPVFTV